MDTKDFLTPNQVAALLMVSPITIRQWAQKGMLPARMTAGGHRRFTTREVAAFARERGMELPGISQRLLVVDDNVQFNHFLLQLFQLEFPELPIHQAFDGFEAGLAVMQHSPSVILLDVMMPGISGLEVCRNLQQNPQTRNIAVIAMTGNHSPELERKMLEGGARVLLKKPFSAEAVIRECGFTRDSTSVLAAGAT